MHFARRWNRWKAGFCSPTALIRISTMEAMPAMKAAALLRFSLTIKSSARPSLHKAARLHSSSGPAQASASRWSRSRSSQLRQGCFTPEESEMFSMMKAKESRRRSAIRQAVESLESRVLLAYSLDPSFDGDGLVVGPPGFGAHDV